MIEKILPKQLNNYLSHFDILVTNRVVLENFTVQKLLKFLSQMIFYEL